MKKIIYFFLAASMMMLIACGGGADANYDEQNIQKTATTLRSLLKKGASFDEVDQALIKAGFVRKADDEPSLSPAARAPKKYINSVATYFLNAPEDFQGYFDYDGEEDSKRIVGFNRIVASNRICAQVYLNFGSYGKLTSFIIDFVMNKDLAQDHSFFIKLDNAIYDESDLVPNTFKGTLYNSYADFEDSFNSQTFSDREKYFAAITNQQSVYTYESYNILLRNTEYRTNMVWRNLSDEVYSVENANILGYKPYVKGSIGIDIPRD